MHEAQRTLHCTASGNIVVSLHRGNEFCKFQDFNFVGKAKKVIIKEEVVLIQNFIGHFLNAQACLLRFALLVEISTSFLNFRCLFLRESTVT